MGCGVAMTVLQTKELISLEVSNKVSKSNLKTNSNILKANQSQASIFRTKESSPEINIGKGALQQIENVPPPKQNLVPKSEQKIRIEQKKVEKIVLPQKNQQKSKQISSITKSNTPLVGARTGKPKENAIQQKTDVPKSPRLPEKNVNIQHNANLKQKQQAKVKQTVKHTSIQAQNKNQTQQTQSLPASKLEQQAKSVSMQPQKSANINANQQPIKQNGQKQTILVKEQKQDISEKQNISKQTLTPKKIEAQIQPQKSKPADKVVQIVKQAAKTTEKTQFIQIEAINRNPTPLVNPRSNGSKVNLDKKESEKKLMRADVSRKSLKAKKMVPVDSLYLQSVITKPEQPELQKQNSDVPQPPAKIKEEVSIRVPQGRKSKNKPIQIVDSLTEVQKNLEKPNILPPSALSKIGASKREQGTKIMEENITRITQQNRKLDEQRKIELSKRKAEQQKRKAEQQKKIQEAKRRIQLQQKKSIEMQASKLKKVYNV